MDAIREQLGADHRVLDDLFCRLLRDVRLLSQRDLRVVWCELERRLLSHMDVEEQLLFPMLEAGHHAAVERARSDHTRIRGLACALGIAIELNTVREPAIKDLICVLHQHAEREDRALYRLACAHAPGLVQCRVTASLRAAGRAAHEAAAKTVAHRSGSHDSVLPPGLSAAAIRLQ